MAVTKSSKKFERIKRDHYPTHESATDALFENQVFNRRICDPCCGPGRLILEAATRHGHSVCGTDIIYGRDFVLSPFLFRECDIITNPPYGDRQSRLALAFIWRALCVTKPWKGKVAMLLPADFDSGVTRQFVFGDHPAFSLRIVLTKRVRIFDNRSGTTNHTWFVWDWKNKEEPKTRYAHISYGD